MIPALGAGGREFESRIAPFWAPDAACLGPTASARALIPSEALLAQMVERKTFNLVVAGSTPAEGVFCAGLA